MSTSDQNLTAQKFAKKLMGKDLEVKNKVAHSIARNRNDPQKLRTLKFMAGLLSAKDGKRAKGGIQIFWNAVMCNVDGVLELGVEAKVALLMHLFSQAMKKEHIDQRIPNLEIAVNLIDEEVLRNLSRWGCHLRESGYLSKRIQERLIEDFTNSSFDSANLEDTLDVICSMIHKFSEEQQSKVFHRGWGVLNSSNEIKWQQTKKDIQLMITVYTKINLDQSMIQQTEVLQYLLTTLYDNNLTEVSSQAIEDLLAKSRNSELDKILIEEIMKSFQGIKTEIQYNNMWAGVELARRCGLCSTEFTQDVIHTLIPLFESSNQKIKSTISKRMIEFMKTGHNCNWELVKMTVAKLLLFLKIDSKWSQKTLASETIIELMKLSNQKDAQDQIEENNGNNTFRKVLDSFADLLGDTKKHVKILALNTIQELVMIKSDPEFTQHALESLTPILKELNLHERIPVLKKIWEFRKIECAELTQRIEEIFTKLSEGPNSRIRDFAQKTLANRTRHDQENALNELIRCLRNPVLDGGNHTLEELRKMMTSSDAQDVPELLSPFFSATNCDLRSLPLKKLAKIVKGNAQFARTIIYNLFMPILEDSHETLRRAISKSIIRLVKESRNSEPQLPKEVSNNLFSFSRNFNWSVKTCFLEIIIELIHMDGGNNIQLASQTLGTLRPLLKDSEIRYQVANHIVKLMHLIRKNDAELVEQVSDVLISLCGNPEKPVRKTDLEKILELIEITHNNFVGDIIKILAPLLENSERIMRIRGSYEIKKLVRSNSISDFELAKILDSLGPSLQDQAENLRTVASEKMIELVKCDVKLLEQSKIFFELIFLKKWETKEMALKTVLASKSFIELMKIEGVKTSRVEEIIEALTPALQDSNQHVKSKTLGVIMELVNILIDKNDIELLRDVLSKFTPFLQDPEPSIRCSFSSILVQIIEKGVSIDPQLIREGFDTLKKLLQDSSQPVKDKASSQIIQLAMINNASEVVSSTDAILALTPLFGGYKKKTRTLICEQIRDLLKVKSEVGAQGIIGGLAPLLQHSSMDVAQMSSTILKSGFLRLLVSPDSISRYLKHSCKSLRDLLTSTLLCCLSKYLEGFRLLDELFQDPRSSLTLKNIEDKLLTYSQKPHQIKEKVRKSLKKLQKSSFSQEILSELKLLLVLEIDHMEALQGPQIIELALLIIGKEEVTHDGSDHKKLIKLVRETLNVQIRNLNNEGLGWISKNHAKLLELYPKAMAFYKEVCHKILKNGLITEVEQELIIKCINSGLTILLTRDGEVILEGSRYKLRGEDIEKSLEKITKTLFKGSRDISVAQYRDYSPIFPKSGLQGMKEAAVDKKEVKSIVDSRYQLRNSSWLLTQLKSTKSTSEIVILETRNAFGDHLIYLLSSKKSFRIYPGEISSLNLQEIFGSYARRGEYYQGEVQELTDEVGQQLFEGKITTPSSQIKDNLVRRSIYFQQELLRQGSQDRKDWTMENLAKKLDNNRVILEVQLNSMNLLNLQKDLIRDYCEGFVSTFSARYSSSQVIAIGKVAINTGTDAFNLLNLFCGLLRKAPTGIMSVLAEMLDTLRRHIKETPIKNEANFIRSIAINDGEVSELAWKAVSHLISTKANRDRILNLKNEKQEITFRNQMEDLLQEFKDKITEQKKLRNLFLRVQNNFTYMLGEVDAHKILDKWVDLKHSNPQLQIKYEQRVQKLIEFAEIVVTSNRYKIKPNTDSKHEPESSISSKSKPTTQFTEEKANSFLENKSEVSNEPDSEPFVEFILKVNKELTQTLNLSESQEAERRSKFW